MRIKPKKLWLVIYLLVILLGVSHCLALALQPIETKQNALKSNDEILKRDKIELEIKKLQKEISSISIGPWLQLGTVVIALLAAGISFWSAWRSQRSQAKTLEIQINQQQKNMISDLLKELGSENQGVRIAAIQALNVYRETHSFMVNLLKYERDMHVIDSIIVAFENEPEHSLAMLLPAARSITIQKAALACELYCSGLSKEEIITLLDFDNAFLSNWMNTSRGKRVAGFFKGKIGYSVVGNKTTEANLLEKEKARILNEWHEANCAYNNVLKAIESVVEKASINKLILTIKDAYLQGAIFDKLNLAGWTFYNCYLRNASFRETICNGVDFSNSTLDKATFKAASLHDSKFDYSSCRQTSFNKAKLIRSSLKSLKSYEASFFDTKIKKANFSDASLVEADFGKAKGKKVNFTRAKMMRCVFEKSIINGSDFTKVNLSEANLDQIQAHKVKFIDCTFYGNKLNSADFRQAEFNGSDFTRVNLSEANLDQIQAHKVKFIDCTFYGNKLNGADFRQAEFIGTKFNAIKQFFGAEFAGAVTHDVEFDDESIVFSQYLISKLSEDIE